MSTTTHTLDVPGAQLYYEVRGTGPVMVVMGSPMASPHFAELADVLASDFTVVTLDPRGIAKSTIEDKEQDSTPELRADDIAALLDALGAESAHVFGSSGGAVTGLALVARHPSRVRTLIAHEPPLLELLPDAEAQRAATEDIIETFHRDGIAAAWFKFMTNAGFDMDSDGAPGGPEEPSEQDIADSARFFAHELRYTTRYLPDVQALTAGPAKVVVGLGVDSGDLLTTQTSVALTKLLGTSPVMFPGDHGGWMGQPKEFAEVLREAL
jgi:pimeloyl-ACP methyl ester carboxylesterase